MRNFYLIASGIDTYEMLGGLNTGYDSKNNRWEAHEVENGYWEK